MPPFCAMHINILAFRKQQGTVYFHFYPILCVYARIGWMQCNGSVQKVSEDPTNFISMHTFRSVGSLKTRAWDFPIVNQPFDVLDIREFYILSL